jgi:hypothetical protein
MTARASTEQTRYSFADCGAFASCAQRDVQKYA